MTDSDFARRWQRRFVQRGATLEDDAGIAGWTPTGLASRFRQFRQLWENVEPPPGHWLDLGCGAGTYTRYLHEGGRKAVGLDYSQPSLHKARQRTSVDIPWVAGDAQRLPFGDDRFDGVLCLGVLQALPEARPALAEMARVVRPGGEIWVDALNARCLPNALGEWRRKRAGRPAHLRYDDYTTVTGELEALGLEVRQVAWLLLLPGRLGRLQLWAEGGLVRSAMRILPGAEGRFCHSFLVQGRVRESSRGWSSE
ncbi:class I SAM-dependent methyltransferase [Halorhodospira halophila]|uniref:class I SAM-dependent methyltransferase n=1 Tax=Halorhodospira halophila TaxID=1053 RepID=UPI0002EF6EB6|nr:class I SAM-dependent methyltransferase [Halorhodospira halophila]MBK1730090.1 class I SAM-dependent methyltransferase [Halorhodospira halophila]